MLLIQGPHFDIHCPKPTEHALIDRVRGKLEKFLLLRYAKKGREDLDISKSSFFQNVLHVTLLSRDVCRDHQERIHLSDVFRAHWVKFILLQDISGPLI